MHFSIHCTVISLALSVYYKYGKSENVQKKKNTRNAERSQGAPDVFPSPTV